MMNIEKSLHELLFEVQLKRTTASASLSCYEILGGIRQKKQSELRLSEFQYAARELRELLAYAEQQIKYMENEL